MRRDANNAREEVENIKRKFTESLRTERECVSQEWVSKLKSRETEWEAEKKGCNERIMSLEEKLAISEQHLIQSKSKENELQSLSGELKRQYNITQTETETLRREKHENEMELRKILGEERAKNVKIESELSHLSLQLHEKDKSLAILKSSIDTQLKTTLEKVYGETEEARENLRKEYDKHRSELTEKCSSLQTKLTHSLCQIDILSSRETKLKEEIDSLNNK